MMTKEEAYKKVCTVLYNGIKEKIKTMYRMHFDYFYLPNSITVVIESENSITIYDGDPFGDTESVCLSSSITDGNIITKTSAPFLPVTSAVALFFLSEFFAQGHKYRIDWERGIDEFGSYSPAIVFDDGATMMDGELNYYLQMVEFLTMGIMTSNNESENK